MKLSRALVSPLICLSSIYGLVVLAGFFAPYDPSTQYRDAASSPPTRIHWMSPERRLRSPFVYASKNSAGQTQQQDQESEVPYPIQFLPRGAQYRVLGVLASDRHLFGVASPTGIYLMGTDNYGRDVFSRLLYGGQISLSAGVLATLLTLILGLMLGMVAGLYGGWKDAVIMRGIELFLALPWLYLLLALRAFLPLHTGPRKTFLVIIAVIGLVGWARPARLIRGVVLSAKERSHVLAAKSFGASDFYLLRRHLLPETRSIVITQAALLIPQYVLAEVTLSFLGLGVGEPVASWGSMLATLQQYHVLVSDWWMFFPGIVLVFVFLSFGALSNALQEASPKLGVEWNGRLSLEQGS